MHVFRYHRGNVKGQCIIYCRPTVVRDSPPSHKLAFPHVFYGILLPTISRVFIISSSHDTLSSCISHLAADILIITTETHTRDARNFRADSPRITFFHSSTTGTFSLISYNSFSLLLFLVETKLCCNDLRQLGSLSPLSLLSCRQNTRSSVFRLVSERVNRRVFFAEALLLLTHFATSFCSSRMCIDMHPSQNS